MLHKKRMSLGSEYTIPTDERVHCVFEELCDENGGPLERDCLTLRLFRCHAGR